MAGEILQTAPEELIPKSILDWCLRIAICDGHSQIVRLLIEEARRDSYSDQRYMADAID